jgi:hypothetical protein
VYMSREITNKLNEYSFIKIHSLWTTVFILLMQIEYDLI